MIDVGACVIDVGACAVYPRPLNNAKTNTVEDCVDNIKYHNWQSRPDDIPCWHIPKGRL